MLTDCITFLRKLFDIFYNFIPVTTHNIEWEENLIIFVWNIVRNYCGTFHSSTNKL